MAVLRFDANNVPNGIWVFTRNSIGTDNTFVLNGLADPRQPTTPSPRRCRPRATGLKTLTLPAGVSGDLDIHGTVLPDGGMFFYTNSSFNHNVLYGRLIRYNNDQTTNRFVTANDGVFFDRLLDGTGGYLGGYVSGVLVDATVESAAANGIANRLTGTYSYPTQPGGYPTRFTMQPDSIYTLPTRRVGQADTNMIVGSYRMAGSSFGGHQVDIDIAVDGSITVSPATNARSWASCWATWTEASRTCTGWKPWAFWTTRNLPTIGCELSTGPSQSGSAAAIFDANGEVVGLRILTAGLLQSGQRAHTGVCGHEAPGT